MHLDCAIMMKGDTYCASYHLNEANRLKGEREYSLEVYAKFFQAETLIHNDQKAQLILDTLEEEALHLDDFPKTCADLKIAQLKVYIGIKGAEKSMKECRKQFRQIYSEEAQKNQYLPVTRPGHPLMINTQFFKELEKKKVVTQLGIVRATMHAARRKGRWKPNGADSLLSVSEHYGMNLTREMQMNVRNVRITLGLYQAKKIIAELATSKEAATHLNSVKKAAKETGRSSRQIFQLENVNLNVQRICMLMEFAKFEATLNRGQALETIKEVIKYLPVVPIDDRSAIVLNVIKQALRT